MLSQRIQTLNRQGILSEKAYVLYWMQASQRVQDNPALSYAVEQANITGKPLVVAFGLTADFPHAIERHYHFMLEGLRDVAKQLHARRIRFLITPKGPVAGMVELAQNSVLVVTDAAYSRTERLWRKTVAQQIPCLLVQVEGNVVVPVESASSKEEYSAATLRRKIEPMISYFAQESVLEDVKTPSEDIDLTIEEVEVTSISSVMETLGVQKDLKGYPRIGGGEIAAQQRLSAFLDQLPCYAEHRNDPARPCTSQLSPYLHFGQISPVTIYRRITSYDSPAVADFVEQLIVRRELAVNFVYYNPQYDRYEALPEWARKSLENHEQDPRSIRYDAQTLLTAATHDPYWNAAQKELVHLGTMHGYMRMYWGKKLLEWANTPQQAFNTALELNNRYQIDGRDPNGFAGVAWCFGKHDRPWVERPIFGAIRYMNDRGLKRKFDIERYVQRVETAVGSL
jgi:deoxyribodipyrimidine photo-lyase